METAIEDRLTALEERLGLPPYDDFKPDIALEVHSLKKKISELGYEFILKVDPHVIKRLCSLTDDPKYATFSEKRASIEFGYELMLERIKLLEQFSKSAEVVLNSKKLTSTAELEPELDSVKKELLSALGDAKKHSEDIDGLKESFCQLVKGLQSQLHEFDEIISKAERSKAKS